MRFVVAAALLIVLAGCADKAGLDSDPETTDDGTVPVQDAESRRAAPVAAASTDTAAPAPQQEYVTSFAEEGFLPPGAVAPGLVSAFPMTSDRWFPVDVNGSVQDVALTMTWEAENPTTERMLLAFGKLERDGNREYAEVYRTAIGASPLELSLEDLDWDDEEYVVWAWFDYNQPVIASVDQPFAIEGTITTLV